MKLNFSPVKRIQTSNIEMHGIQQIRLIHYEFVRQMRNTC